VFDAVIVAASEAGVDALLHEAAAVDWVRDAFGHLKTLGFTAAAEPLLAKAGVAVGADEGVVRVDGKDLDAFVAAAKQHRIWKREPAVRTPG
jgi:catalase